MKILEITNNCQNELKEVVDVIKTGGLVVFPSDTVYILAVDPTNKKGVKKLLEFKNRWTGKAISVAVLNKKMAEDFVNLNESSKAIYKNLLPGPFTVVSEGKHKVVKGIEAENGTLGIRIPNNKYIHDLVELLGKPITATSANLSGRTPNYSVKSFLRQLSGKKKSMLDLVVDVGKLDKNKPSTVIDVSKPELKILRRGDLILGLDKKVLISKSEKETEKIAEYLLHKFLSGQNPSVSLVSEPAPLDEGEPLKQSKPLVFLLSGDLGCGKTVFSRKIGKLLGVKGRITSPTFVIYNEYPISPNPSLTRGEQKNNKFLHMDLYQITTKRDLEEINFLDLFEDNTVSCIEWPENMGEEFLKKLKKRAKIIPIHFSYLDEKTREIKY